MKKNAGLVKKLFNEFKIGRVWPCPKGTDGWVAKFDDGKSLEEGLWIYRYSTTRLALFLSREGAKEDRVNERIFALNIENGRLGVSTCFSAELSLYLPGIMAILAGIGRFTPIEDTQGWKVVVTKKKK
jgi:hypothetical protein